MTESPRTRTTELVGYGLGDMASSMFWKIFSYYLPFFYSNIYGLRMTDAALLVLLTRLWDAISDPMMGVLADRTHSRWGKYRPYLLWMALPFGICGVLLFSTPAADYTCKLWWAYTTYLLMMTVYTAINVPYGSMLGVMTDDPRRKTLYASYRMFFAYVGSFIALLSWEPLTTLFQSIDTASTEAWQHTMMAVASVCVLLFLMCFWMTKERVHSISSVSVWSDLKHLMHNRPWWLMITLAMCFNLFCTVRGAVTAYYFADVIGKKVSLTIGPWSLLFYAGLFLSVGEVSNMVGVAAAMPLSRFFQKKTCFTYCCLGLAVWSVTFFYVPLTPIGYWYMLFLQVLIGLLTGILSPLIWSMYADVSDYGEYKNHTASTGLIFSSSSMAQKFGSAFGGWVVLMLLGLCGYQVHDGSHALAQSPTALTCLRMLLSYIPALIAVVGMVACHFYPLTDQYMAEINTKLKDCRK